MPEPILACCNVGWSKGGARFAGGVLDSPATELMISYAPGVVTPCIRFSIGVGELAGTGRKNVMRLSGWFPLSILPDPDLKNPQQAARDFSLSVDHTARPVLHTIRHPCGGHLLD